MENLLPILGLATLGSLAGLLGGVVLIFNKKWGSTLSRNAVPFAAGVLLSVSLLDILPEALENSDPSVVLSIVLLVLVAAFLFEELIVRLHHHEKDTHTPQTALPLVVIGDTVHNFIDGVLIAAAYLISPAMGVLVALATFFHETPHEISDFGLMLASGWSRTKALAVNVVSALTTYLGAILVIFFFSGIEESLGVLLAVAGGMFLYIGASDLLPAIHAVKKGSTLKSAALLLAGVFLIWIISNTLSF